MPRARPGRRRAACRDRPASGRRRCAPARPAPATPCARCRWSAGTRWRAARPASPACPAAPHRRPGRRRGRRRRPPARERRRRTGCSRPRGGRRARRRPRRRRPGRRHRSAAPCAGSRRRGGLGGTRRGSAASRSSRCRSPGSPGRRAPGSAGRGRRRRPSPSGRGRRRTPTRRPVTSRDGAAAAAGARSDRSSAPLRSTARAASLPLVEPQPPSPGPGGDEPGDAFPAACVPGRPPPPLPGVPPFSATPLSAGPGPLDDRALDNGLAGLHSWHARVHVASSEWSATTLLRAEARGSRGRSRAPRSLSWRSPGWRHRRRGPAGVAARAPPGTPLLSRLRMLHRRVLPAFAARPAGASWQRLDGHDAVLDLLSQPSGGPVTGFSLAAEIGAAEASSSWPRPRRTATRRSPGSPCPSPRWPPAAPGPCAGRRCRAGRCARRCS